MLTEEQSKLELSPRDYFQTMATAENGLGQLASALEEQENILEENESEDSSLFQSLNELKKFDPEIYIGVMDSLAELVKSKKVDAKDIPKLISRINTRSNASADVLKEYGASRGAMSWQNFEVTIYDSLKDKDPEGKNTRNISHHLNHEIGHSILEIGATNLEDAEAIFKGIGTKFESVHIIKLIDAKAPDKLLLKERFAELAAIYMRSESVEDFYQNRVNLCPVETKNEIDEKPEVEEEFKTECVELYQRIDAIWPQIKRNLAEVNLEDHIQNTESMEGMFNFDELGEEQILPGEMEESAEGLEGIQAPTGPQSGGQDSGSEGAEGKKTPQSFKETADLAKEPKADESVTGHLKELAKSFGELDIFSGVQQ